MKTPNFDADLERGAKGVEALKKLLPGMVSLSGRVIDVIYENRRGEVKTDFTDYDTLFMEVFSVKEQEKMGGPIQADANGALDFWYYAYRKNLAYRFKDIPALIERVKALADSGKAKYKTVPNSGYTTTGYSVQPEDIMSICEVYDFA